MLVGKVGDRVVNPSPPGNPEGKILELLPNKMVHVLYRHGLENKVEVFRFSDLINLTEEELVHDRKVFNEELNRLLRHGKSQGVVLGWLSDKNTLEVLFS